jgi:hypothetical protein
MKEIQLLFSFLLVIIILATPVIGKSDNETIINPTSSNIQDSQVFIDPLSVRSLYLIQIKDNQALGMATGFIVQKANKYYLITNWHVVSGRNPETDQVQHPSGQTPDALYIWHHGKQLGSWHRHKEELYDKKGIKCWLEHKNGKAVDVVALPLQNIGDNITIYPFDLSMADVNVVPEIAMPVSIIGFPLGFTSAGFFPIWKTGHIASEPTLDYHGEPLFLIDATTRGGMSGSPVVFRPTGTYKNKNGQMAISSNMTLFLGVYSGRLSQDSEIGKIWRPRLINEILQ